ncbi:MAG: linear amide C-N hydrolase [Desulfovibrio sp.]
MDNTMLHLTVAALVMALILLVPAGARACTRAVYLGKDGMVITGRSMDWSEDIKSNLWVFPQGMARDGAAGPDSVTWTSKYGSVVASGYDVGTADGLNEKGLAANLLYLAESEYGTPAKGKKLLNIGAWAQYVLDNFATVAEAVKALAPEPFVIVAPALPNGKASALHLSLSDASGDSAIFEYVGGKLVIHHGRQYQVMTNSPTFDQQLALNTYWNTVGGQAFLPGTVRAADRFVRASYFLGLLPQTADAREALAGIVGVLRTVSVPLGVSDPGQPNISPTRWRTFSDQKDLIYFFDSATSPSLFWVKLADLDFTKGAPVRKLTLTDGQLYSGNATDKFVPTAPFVFLPYTPEQ